MRGEYEFRDMLTGLDSVNEFVSWGKLVHHIANQIVTSGLVGGFDCGWCAGSSGIAPVAM